MEADEEPEPPPGADGPMITHDSDAAFADGVVRMRDGCIV